MIRPPTSMTIVSESTAMHREMLWAAMQETAQHTDADQAMVADVK